MTISEYSDFYHNFFKPAYADLVAIIADKPQQIIFEIENSFSHLMVYHSTDPEISTDVKNDNLIKAHNHLVRATMDCYKILWTELSNFLDKILENSSSRAFSFNDSESEIMKIWKNFKEKAVLARKEEMKSVGVNYIETINLYKEAVDEGRVLLEKYDFDKSNKVKRFNFFNLLKNQGLGFMLGIISGIIATWIMS
ncbi:MAG: hypothetical protein COA39_012320 [Sulfurimonas sp.]|nr:hypothetical protein [Sulfurimonas sp.]